MDHDIFESWSQVYDVVNDDKGSDVDLYLDQAKRAADPVLEIGCGTGRVYLELLSAGVDAYGIDASPSMLRELRENAEARGLSPAVRRADMRSFSFDREFGLITIPFQAFRYNLTPDDQLATLRNVREHLADGGRLVLDFHLPWPGVLIEPHEVTEEVTDGDREFRLVETYSTENGCKQVLDISRELYEDGDLVADAELQYAQIYKREFDHLLRLAGFESWTTHGGFDYRPLDPDEISTVWVARV